MQDFNINQTIYDGRPIKVFLSYSSDDRHQAGVIKAVLENYGFDVFLAHHDIEPSKHWLAEIIHEIKECSIFIPFLTPNSLNSYYVNQEIGMACVDSKKLIFL